MIFLLLALTFTSLQAQTMNFVCESETSRHLDLFTLEGSVDSSTVQGTSFVDAHFKATTLIKPAGMDSKAILIENIDQMAKIKEVAAPAKKYLYINTKLKAREQVFEYKIYLGYPAKYNSLIKNLETRKSYRAFCKLI